MTDEERHRLEEAKRNVTETLAAERIGRYALGRVDPRLTDYVREVANNPQRHNLWEQLAVLRFLRMCEKYGLRVDKIRQFFYLYEHLHFPGKVGDCNYRLTPVQAFQFANIFGFWEGDRRVVREACLFVPRKFSKTTSTASLAVYDILYGDANAEAYVGANSSDQARKCFDVIRGCFHRLDPKGLRYIVNEEKIKSRRRDRSAFAQCLTATARTKDGLNPSTIIMDEFSQARDNRLLTVLTTGTGNRTNPLTVIITTASDLFEGPFYSMLNGYKSLLLGDYEDDSVFAHLFEPDIGDDEAAESTWLKVHPHIGVTVSLDFYRREYQSALRNGADAMLAFRTKLLNVYAENEARAWISATTARECMKPFNLEDITGKPMGVVAIDLSESDDFSAVSFAIHDRKRGETWFNTRYFFPRGALRGHPNEQLYRKWAEAGWLTLCEGPVIDYDMIADYVLRINDFVRVVGVGYDPYKSKTVVNKIGNSRPGAWDVVKPVQQNMASFTAAVEALEHGIKTGRCFINPNPINAYCFGNAVLLYDTNGNCKPWHRTEMEKIDGVITMLMCEKQIIDWLWNSK